MKPQDFQCRDRGRGRRVFLPNPLICLSLVLLAGIGSINRTAATEVADTSPEVLKKMSLEELLDIRVTSVAKHAQKLSETPSAIQVISGEEIRRSGASSIPEALRLADNLQVAQKGSHGWAISARGFNTDSANKLLVLMDGRTVYTPLFSGVFWDQQDYLLADIDRIEVISGPGGTLWGANAVNGVINIISKNARDTQGFYFEGGGGAPLQDFVGARYGGVLASNVYFRIYGKYFDRNSEVFPNGDSAGDSWRMGQGGFRLDAEPSEANTFTLQGDVYGSDENIATGRAAEVNGNNVLGRWTHTFSDDSDMSLQLYYDRTHLHDPVPANAFAPAGTLTDDLDTYDVDFQHRIQLGDRNRLIWGMGYRFTHDEVENSPALAFAPTLLEQNLFSAFAQDEFQLIRQVTLTLGTKVEHNDYTGFEYEPSARLAWSPTEQHTFWAAISRAVRAPSRVDRDIRLPTPGAAPLVDNLLVGGADFQSETVVAYELGYRALLGEKISASIATFYNDYDDIRSTSLSPPDPVSGLPFPLYYANNLTGHTYGMELSATYQVQSWWRLRAGYNLLKEYIHVKSGQSDFNNALNETADPEQQFSIRSSLDLPYHLELDGGLRWVDSFTYNVSGSPATVPAYMECDVRLGWHPTKNLEISIVGQNLLQDHHLEYVISSPNPQEEVVRSIYGKLTWQW